MRVLHVLNSLATGGAEKLILDTIPLYNANGVKADVVVFQNKNYAFHKALQETESCKIYNLEVDSVYSPASIFKMMRLLKNYDIAHVHLFPAQYYVVLAKILSFSKIKLVYTEHSTQNRRLNNFFYKFIDKFIYLFYSKTICISNDVQQVIEKHIFSPTNKITLIENGVDISKIINAESYGNTFLDKKVGDTFVIMVASLRAGKDQETLIKALPYLQDAVKLILVGDGHTRSYLENVVEQLKLTSRVFFLGIRTDIPNLLKTADIVVLSSHFEGMSLSSIEGMASGKPFIASNVPGLREMVSGHGILFEDSNEKELASYITALLEDKEKYRQIAEACVAHAKNFDIKIMVKKHLELYKQLYNA